MPRPILPMGLYYDGTFGGYAFEGDPVLVQTVPGSAGSTSGASGDVVTVGTPNQWTDVQGGRWFILAQGAPFPYSELDCESDDGVTTVYPYAPLVRPANETYADQRCLLAQLHRSGNHMVVLRYRDAAAYLPLAFYLFEYRYDGLRISACCAGMADIVLAEMFIDPAGPAIDDILSFDVSAIRFWPTRLFLTLTNVTTGGVIGDLYAEDSTPELQQPGVAGLANQTHDWRYDFDDNHDLGGDYHRVQIYGTNRWQNQPVVVLFSMADVAGQCLASVVLSARVYPPLCNSLVLLSARAQSSRTSPSSIPDEALFHCSAGLILSASSVCTSAFSPHSYSKSAVASVVLSGSSTAVRGRHVTASVFLHASATGVPAAVRHVTATALVLLRADALYRGSGRFAYASFSLHAVALENVVRPAVGVVQVLLRAVARRNISSVLRDSVYLGRFQAGDEVPLFSVSHDSHGAPVAPAASPIARVYALDEPGWRDAVSLVRLRRSRSGAVFTFALPIGPSYPLGRYAILYQGMPGLALGTFEIVPGGDGRGPLIAVSALDEPGRLVAQAGGGVLLVGTRPKLT